MTRLPSSPGCISFWLLSLTLLLLPVELRAHDQHNRVQPSGSEVRQVRLQVPDLELTDQNGRHGRLLSDFIGEEVVAFTFVYTTCTTICPVIDGIFRNLQGRFGDRLGGPFRLLTLTIDSAVDIPARIREHTAKLGVRPGWSYLTGDKQSVTRILKALEVYTPDIRNHPPAVFVVDGRRGNWYRLNGFPSPALIEETMQQQLVAH